MDRAEAPSIRVEVVYCPKDAPADRSDVRLAPGSTVADALRASGVLTRHAELASREAVPTGIWGKVCAAEARLRDGDRVELYRRLTVDPKEARRLRYRNQKPPQRVPKGQRRRGMPAT